MLRRAPRRDRLATAGERTGDDNNHQGSNDMHRGPLAIRVRVGVGQCVAAALCLAGCSGRTGLERASGSVAAVRPGITVLLDDSLGLIAGKRIALLTNQTGVDASGVSDIELLRGDHARSAGVTLVRLFSPEHGIRGTEDREHVESGIDERSGLAVHSLYTVTAIAPPDSLLRDIDALVFDLQDIGTRTWTYVGSMIYAMRAAARIA